MNYCTYLTIYKGNKLPPFYIGYTQTKKIAEGYRGSVSSKKYKDAWNHEQKENPHLFKTVIISHHNSAKEANEKEKFLQKKMNVIYNPLYTNKAIGWYSDQKGVPKSEEWKMKMRGRPKSEEWKQKMRKPKSDDHKIKIGLGNRGKVISESTKEKLRIVNIGRKRKPFSIEHRRKISEANKRRWSKDI